MSDKKQNKYSGQVGLLILLVVGVVVTIVMSVASNTLNDLTASRRNKESGQVFRVAESGIEQALNELRQNPNLDNKIGSLQQGLIQGQYQIAKESGVEIKVKEGEVVDIDLNGFSGSEVDVYWVVKYSGEDVQCKEEGSGQAPAAIEISKYKVGNIVERSYYNASNCASLASSNHFNTALVSNQQKFVNLVKINNLSSVDRLRVRPIYNGATFLISGNGLSKQFYVIKSYAQEASEARKDVEFVKTREAPASIFDFAIFAGGTIVK